MIRDVMVWLDGGISDEVRLAAVAEIARRLENQVIIGLFLNPLPLPGPVDGHTGGALVTAELMDRAGQGQGIEKQSDDHLALEPSGNFGDSCQANFIGDTPIQPNHHVLDHRYLLAQRQTPRWNSLDCTADWIGTKSSALNRMHGYRCLSLTVVNES